MNYLKKDFRVNLMAEKMSCKRKLEETTECEEVTSTKRLSQTSSLLKPDYKALLYATEVSSLIGKDPYLTKTQALYRLLNKDRDFAFYINKIKKETNNTKEDEVKKFLNQKQVKAKVIQIVSEISLMKNLSDLDDLIAQKVDVFMKTIKTLESDVFQRVRKDMIGLVNMKRGIIRENDSLNKLRQDYGLKIINGNTKTYKFNDYSSFYEITGRVDGFNGRRVIEVKNRTRPNNGPPEKDRLQVLIYLKMLKLRNGILVEHFPNEKIEKTDVNYNEDEFKDIHQKLVEIVTRVRKMTKNDLEELIIQNDKDYFSF